MTNSKRYVDPQINNPMPFMYGFAANALYDFDDKDLSIRQYVNQMLKRTMSMFDYENLPDTMPKWAIEVGLQLNGVMGVIEHEGDIYCLVGNWGGEPNAYYMPQDFIIANPYLKLSKTYKIDTDCVLWRNDSLFEGMAPLYSRYAQLMVENVISLRMADINARIPSIIESLDDKTKAAGEKYIQDVIKGKMSVFASTKFVEALRTQPYNVGSHSTGQITDLIEYQQYLRAGWFNDMGLNANYNMKRESINSGEAQLNDDMLLPLIDDLFNCRVENVEKCNEMFGTDIRVSKSSAWLDNEIELELEQEILKNQANDDNEDEEDFSDYSESDEENEIEETV